MPDHLPYPRQSHPVKEERLRIHLRHLIHEANGDPNKVVSSAGGDPGIRIILKANPLAAHDIETHIARFYALYGKQASAAVDGKLLIESLELQHPTLLLLPRYVKRLSLDDIQRTEGRLESSNDLRAFVPPIPPTHQGE